MPMAQGFRARSPRIHRLSTLKKHLVQGSGSEMPMPSGFQVQERQQAQHGHHARDTAPPRTRTPNTGNGREISAGNSAAKTGPLPIVGLRREPLSTGFSAVSPDALPGRMARTPTLHLPSGGRRRAPMA